MLEAEGTKGRVKKGEESRRKEMKGDERRRKEKEKDERRWNVLEAEGMKRSRITYPRPHGGIIFD